MKLKNKIVALFLTVACVFGLAVANKNVTKVEAAEEKLTLSFASKDQRTSFTTTQQVWEQNGVKLVNDKGSSTSAVADYYNPARFYKSSKLTISTENNISKIEFICNSSSYAEALVGSITTSPAPTSSGSKVTVTLDGSANSYVINSLSGGQVRMNSLNVYVIPAVSGDATDEDIVAAAAEAITVPTTVISSITLPTVGAGDAKIAWSSSDPDTLGDDGVVVLRDVDDTPIVLTATVSFGQATTTKTFNVNVLGENTIVANTIDSLSVPATTVASFTLPTKANEVATITWESDDEEILTNTGKLVSRPAQDTIVTLMATVTVGGVSDTTEFDVLVKARRDIVTVPEVNTYYKMVVTQANLNKDLYMTGSMSGYYYATTEDASKAALVSLEATEGGYYLISTVNGSSKYMNVKASGTFINAYFEASPVSVWTFNSTYNTFTTKVGSETYYLGAYNSYDTYSPSKLSYLSGSSNFAAHLVELTDVEKVATLETKVQLGLDADLNAKLRFVGIIPADLADVVNFDDEFGITITMGDITKEYILTKENLVADAEDPTFAVVLNGIPADYFATEITGTAFVTLMDGSRVELGSKTHSVNSIVEHYLENAESLGLTEADVAVLTTLQNA